MIKKHLTTTEAAKLLSVSADTVLKWVRAGKIESYRTPGGHARIPYEAVAKLLPNGTNSYEEMNGLDDDLDKPVFKYCWDFYAKDGNVKEDCLDCVAFKSRAQRCYEMRGIPEEFGLLRLHCKSKCEECEFFRLKQGQAANALILVRDRGHMNSLLNEAEDSPLVFKFVLSEYECAALVERFRPDYVVLDCAIGQTRIQDLCQNLIQDERIPNVRIILSSKKARAKDYCDNEAFGWITKPFSIKQLEELISGAVH